MPSPIRTAARRRPVLFAVPLLLGLAALLGACQLAAVASREWSTTSTNDTGGPHAVSLADRTGNVAEVQFFPEDADLFGGVTVAPGQPDALDITWTGGPCDAATDIEVTGQGAGLGVLVTITPDGNPCDAMGTPRAVRVTLSQPVAPGLVVVTQEQAAP